MFIHARGSSWPAARGLSRAQHRCRGKSHDGGPRLGTRRANTVSANSAATAGPPGTSAGPGLAAAAGGARAICRWGLNRDARTAAGVSDNSICVSVNCPCHWQSRWSPAAQAGRAARDAGSESHHAAALRRADPAPGPAATRASCNSGMGLVQRVQWRYRA